MGVICSGRADFAEGKACQDGVNAGEEMVLSKRGKGFIKVREERDSGLRGVCLLLFGSVRYRKEGGDRRGGDVVEAVSLHAA